MNTPISTGQAIGAITVPAAMVTVFQVILQIMLPEHYWSVVQAKAEFWPSVQLLIGFMVLRAWPSNGPPKYYEQGNYYSSPPPLKPPETKEK